MFIPIDIFVCHRHYYDMNRIAYVYALTCLPTGEAYVGCTFNRDERWWRHRHNLRLSRHLSPRLQAVWDEHGEDAFEFTILEAVKVSTRAEKFAAETKWVATHGVLNQMPATPDGKRFMMADEVKNRMSDQSRAAIAADPVLREALAERGKAIAALQQSEEGRENMRQHTARRWQDPQQATALKQGLINRWNDPTARERQAEKIAAVMSDPERIKSHSAQLKEKWADPNSKLRNRKQTRWADPEAKAKHAEKMRARWAKWRADRGIA